MRTATRRATVYARRRADWWTVAGQTCVAAYKAIGAADLATSYVNLANPGTYNAAPGIAPGLAAGGWTFNGTDQYLDTGVVAVATTTAIIRFSDATGGAAAPLIGSGSNAGGQAWQIQPRDTTGAPVAVFVFGASYQTYTAQTSGVMAMVGNVCYVNGAQVATVASAFAANVYPLFIAARNNEAADRFCNTTIAAIAIYSTTLSAGDVAAQTVKMQGLA